MIYRLSSSHQRGIALLGILFVLVTLVLGSLLSAWSNRQAIESRERATQAALQQAKEALIGYAAAYAGNPGHLPCPEDTDKIGSSLEGSTQPACSTTALPFGRLPWRTLKTGKLLDGDAAPLWYALSPGFSSAPINLNTVGQLSVDGVPNAAVAVILAPGAALPGQQRSEPTAANPPQAGDYLDQSNPAGSFVSHGPAATFNDRILIISQAELFNAVNRTVLAEIRGLDDQAPGLPIRGLRGYFTDHGGFPWAADPGSGSAVTNRTNGSLPYNDLDYHDSAWLNANGWLPLVSYKRISASQSQIQLGATTMTVVPCMKLPCP